MKLYKAAVWIMLLGALVTGCNKEQEPPSAEPLKAAGAQGIALTETLNKSIDMTAAIESHKGYEPLTVSRAFIDGGSCARVIVHNNTDTSIVAYDLEILYFDSKGNPLGKSGEYTVWTGVVEPHCDYGLDSYVGGSNGGSYIKGIVKKVAFNDGTSWENEIYEAEKAVYNDFFDIEKYRQDIEKNSENVQKAAQTPYIRIDDMTMTGSDDISSRKDLKLVLTNTGDKTLKEIKVAVAEFDRNNNKVDVTPQIYIGKNIRLASCTTTELKPGESRSFSSSAFLESECFRINAIVTEITFTDGTVWKNPYAIDWLLWFM